MRAFSAPNKARCAVLDGVSDQVGDDPLQPPAVGRNNDLAPFGERKGLQGEVEAADRVLANAHAHRQQLRQQCG